MEQMAVTKPAAELKSSKQLKVEQEKLNRLITRTLRQYRTLYEESNYEEAERVLMNALKESEESEHHYFVGLLNFLLGLMASEQADLKKAERIIVHVIHLMFQQDPLLTSQLNEDNLLTCLILLAENYEQMKDFEKTEELLKFCMRQFHYKIVDNVNYRKTVNQYREMLFLYANFLIRQNRQEEAFNYLQEAYLFCVRLNKESTPSGVQLLWTLGEINDREGRTSDGFAYKRKAIDIGIALHLFNDQKFVEKCVVLSKDFIEEKMYTEAKRLCREIMSQCKDPESIGKAKDCLTELEKF